MYSLDGIIGVFHRAAGGRSVMGLAFCLLAFVLILYFFIKTLFWGDPVAGFPAMITIILFLGGVQLFSIGILGQYLSKTYLETKRRPIYITAKRSEPMRGTRAFFVARYPSAAVRPSPCKRRPTPTPATRRRRWRRCARWRKRARRLCASSVYDDACLPAFCAGGGRLACAHRGGYSLSRRLGGRVGAARPRSAHQPRQHRLRAKGAAGGRLREKPTARPSASGSTAAPLKKRFCAAMAAMTIHLRNAGQRPCPQPRLLEAVGFRTLYSASRRPTCP